MTEQRLVEWLTYELLKAIHNRDEAAKSDDRDVSIRNNGLAEAYLSTLQALGYIYPCVCPECGVELQFDASLGKAFCPKEETHFCYKSRRTV